MHRPHLLYGLPQGGTAQTPTPVCCVHGDSLLSGTWSLWLARGPTAFHRGPSQSFLRV